MSKVFDLAAFGERIKKNEQCKAVLTFGGTDYGTYWKCSCGKSKKDECTAGGKINVDT